MTQTQLYEGIMSARMVFLLTVFLVFNGCYVENSVKNPVAKEKIVHEPNKTENDTKAKEDEKEGTVAEPIPLVKVPITVHNSVVEKIERIQKVDVADHSQMMDGKKVNDIARAIAGLRTDIEDETYKQYADAISQNWENLCSKSLMKVRPWAQLYLDEHVNHIGRIFYVFGGPDIGYVHEFFPYADEYILVGLERVGKLDNVERIIKRNKFNVFLKAVSSYLQKGYFITSEMGPQFSDDGSCGGLGIVLLQLAKLNAEVVSIQRQGIDENGNIVADGKDVLSVTKIVFKNNTKVSFDFNTTVDTNINPVEAGVDASIDANNEKLRTVYYIRMNVENYNVNRLKMLTNFVRKKSFLTFIKSASYALHDRNFSTLRDFILNNTDALLQDDTGIAFSRIKNWTLTLYGAYTEPTLKVFSRYKQPDLAKYFANNPSTPITFPIGYGFDVMRPSLVLAIPKRM